MTLIFIYQTHDERWISTFPASRKDCHKHHIWHFVPEWMSHQPPWSRIKVVVRESSADVFQTCVDLAARRGSAAFLLIHESGWGRRSGLPSNYTTCWEPGNQRSSCVIFGIEQNWVNVCLKILTHQQTHLSLWFTFRPGQPLSLVYCRNLFLNTHMKPWKENLVNADKHGERSDIFSEVSLLLYTEATGSLLSTIGNTESSPV